MRLVGLRQNNRKLVAAIPASDIHVITGAFAHHLAYGLKDAVPFEVTMRVIIILEVVHVKQQQRQRVMLPFGAFDLHLQTLVKIALIIKIGQVVLDGHFL